MTDNSPGEETAAAVRPLLDRWPGPTRYSHNVPNIGMVGNFNRCVELATSPWVMILHDDDYLAEGGLRRLLAGLGATEADDRAVLFGVRVVNGQGRLLRRQLPTQRRRLEPEAALCRHLSRSSYIRFPAMVVHRDAYAAVGPFDDSVGGATDFDMWSRVLARFGLKLEPQLTVNYVVHAEAATEQMFSEDYLLKICDIFDRAATFGVLPVAEVRKAQAHWFHQFVLAGAVRRLRRGDRASARQVLDLLQHENVKALGVSWRWYPVRLGLRAIAGRTSDTPHPPGLADPR